MQCSISRFLLRLREIQFGKGDRPKIDILEDRVILKGSGKVTEIVFKDIDKIEIFSRDMITYDGLFLSIRSGDIEILIEDIDVDIVGALGKIREKSGLGIRKIEGSVLSTIGVGQNIAIHDKSI